MKQQKNPNNVENKPGNRIGNNRVGKRSRLEVEEDLDGDEAELNNVKKLI